MDPVSSRETIIRGCLFLAGPTAVGKTAFALALAEVCNGEIIGADAFQLYQGLPILTACPTAEEQTRAPHHLVATIPLAEPYSVARYLHDALAIAAAILARGKTPIFAGGTGLYLRAVMRGLSDAPPADEALRQKLNALPLEEALLQLEQLDPEAAATVDRRNPRRVTRALEVCLSTGRPFSSFRGEWGRGEAPPGLLLLRDREELYERIGKRTEAMFQAGVVEEVRQARPHIGLTAAQVLGWQEICAHLDGALSLDECKAAIAQATRHYAKRQLTWFRREPTFYPVHLNDSHVRNSDPIPAPMPSVLPEPLASLVARVAIVSADD